jgi:hypothetical protein
MINYQLSNKDNFFHWIDILLLKKPMPSWGIAIKQFLMLEYNRLSSKQLVSALKKYLTKMKKIGKCHWKLWMNFWKVIAWSYCWGRVSQIKDWGLMAKRQACLQIDYIIYLRTVISFKFIHQLSRLLKSKWYLTYSRIFIIFK